MKIAKALKLKNQLGGDVAQLKELLAKQNSSSTKQKSSFIPSSSLIRRYRNAELAVRHNSEPSTIKSS